MKNKILKISVLVIMIIVSVFVLTGCTEEQTTDTRKDVEATLNIGDKLTRNQPTPKDMDYSLERYNLIRRAYWVNGQREKANTLVCEIEKALSYLETVDCMTLNKTVQTASSKKVNKTYDILNKLKKNLQGGY